MEGATKRKQPPPVSGFIQDLKSKAGSLCSFLLGDVVKIAGSSCFYPETDKLLKDPTAQAGGYAEQPPDAGSKQAAVVVVQQPSPAEAVVVPQSADADADTLGRLIFPLITTIIVVACCCWWVLPCIVTSLVLGIMSTDVEKREETTKRLKGVSWGCSILALGFGALGIAIIVGIVVGLVTPADPCRDFPYDPSCNDPPPN